MGAVDEAKATCNYCGSARLSRLASRVRVIRGGGSKSDADTAPAAPDGMDNAMMGELGGLDENDPRSLGRFMRKMASESGEELGPEFNEIVGRLEKGEDPEKIEQSMGDLLGGAGDNDMMDDGMGAPPPAQEVEPEPAAPTTKTKQRAVRAKPQRRPPTKPKTKSRSGSHPKS